MAFYLGGNVKFGTKTVWVEPVVEDWSNFEIEYNPENPWLQRSIKLLQKSVEKVADNYFVWMPDFGDALTCLSLLRGTERLLFDLIDNKDAVIAARDKFIELWPQYHKVFWDIYREHYPGDCSCLGWAPGRTYMCQCDFSTMISPAMFKELEAVSGYLDYIVWHLDGPDEIKHLDILLDLPQVKAIQWQPGAGNPSAVGWLEMLKKIQKKHKGLCVYAHNQQEIEFLLGQLSPRGLRIEFYDLQ